MIDTARSIRQDVANNINHLDSSRGSSSFAKTVVINPVKSAQFRNDQASILRLSEKEILIAYSQYFNSTEDGTNISIATSKSTDNGLTFPASTRIDTNIYVPSLYQKGNKIGCIYLKKSGTLLNQVWEMESADGGATWINNRMIVGTTTSYYSPTSNVIYRKGGKLYY